MATCVRQAFVRLVLLQLVLQVQPLVSSVSLTPPSGNSIALKAVALDGKLEYICERAGGEWSFRRKSATLKDQTNHTKVVGFYVSNSKINQSSTHVGSWTLINSEGDRVESGQPTSIVSGKQLACNHNGRVELPNFLARASLHRYEGSARQVSYISQLNGKVSSHLPSSKCKASKSTLNIHFKADYVFWKQDILPPKVPKTLSVPYNHQPVEAFFAQGVIRYIYDYKVKSWRQRKILARLYDVPGGIKIGGFTYNTTLSSPKNSSHQPVSNDFACIIISNPNGFQVCGRGYGTPTRVNQSSLPWSLIWITRNIGDTTKMVGPFSYVQMVSTWEELQPKKLNATNFVTPFQVQKSSFTAILWLYTKK